MTYTGPFPFTNTGTIDGILVATSFAGNVANDGTITTNGIAVVGSTITGQILSTSNLAGGVNIDRNSVVNVSGIAIAVLSGSFAGGIHNGGTLSGSFGIYVSAATTSFSGSITNTGTINASAYGMDVQPANASVIDSGTISASVAAIVFLGAHSTLTLAAGYSITGNVLGSGSDTLQLGGSGSATFDPSKIGSAAQYRGFTTFNVVGGTWRLTAAAAESWTIKAGTLELGAGSSIVGQTITFGGSGATLQIDTAMSQIAGSTIASAMIGDAFDLRFQAYSAGMHAVWTHTNDMVGTLALLAGNGTTLATFNLTGVYDAAQFQVSSDSSGDTLIQVTAPLLPTLSVQSGTQPNSNFVPLSTFVTISDPDSVGYKQLQLWDSAGGGQFFAFGALQTPGHEIDVPQASVSTVDYYRGLAVSPGMDTLWARLLENDGTLTPWQQFTVTVSEPTLTTNSLANIVNSASLRLLSASGLPGLITINDPSGVGYQKLELWDSVGGAGGVFLTNSGVQNAGTEIDLTPTQGANATFQAASGAGTDTLWARLLETDGTLTPWQQFTVTVPTPTLTVQNSTKNWFSSSPLSLLGVTISDPGNVGYQQLELWESSGGGHFVALGTAQTAGHEIDVPLAAVGGVSYITGRVAGTDTLWARLQQSDGSLTDWQSFTVTVAEPSLTINNTAVTVAKSSVVNVLGGLLTINDPSGVGYTQLQLWDSLLGTGGGLFNGGTPYGTGAEIDLTPTQAAAVTFKAAPGAGTEKLSARLLEKDGTLTPWQTFTVSVPQPSLTLHNLFQQKSWNFFNLQLSLVSDPGNVGYQKLEVWDSLGGSGGAFYLNGGVQTAGHEIDVIPGATLSYITGTTGGTDRLSARLLLNDGTLTDWQSFAGGVPQPTVSQVQGGTFSATEGQSINLSDLFSISDPSGVGYQTLELWESLGGAGGQLAVSGMVQTGGHEIDISPADFADTVFNASLLAGGADKLSARLLQNDGTLTDLATVSVTTAPAPTLNVHNFSGADQGQFIPLSSMVTVLDPGHENYQTLELWDSTGTVGGGVLVVNNVGQTAGHEIDVSLTDAAITGFFAGNLGVTDKLWAQLQQNDGTTTGWQLFTVSTHT